MAVDHALAVTRPAGTAVLRFYEWATPTVSFGRNEPSRDRWRCDQATSLGLAFVRRPTGGRCVLHDRELTYSVAVARGQGLRARDLYRWVQERLVDGLRRVGVLGASQASAHASELSPDTARPCFDGPAAGEIVLQGRKIVGSAQARLGPALLQHGAILRTNDQKELDALGRFDDPAHSSAAITLAEVGVDLPAAELAVALSAAFADAIAQPLGCEPDQPALHESIGRWTQHYRDDTWTWRR